MGKVGNILPISQFSMQSYPSNVSNFMDPELPGKLKSPVVNVNDPPDITFEDIDCAENVNWELLRSILEIFVFGKTEYKYPELWSLNTELPTKNLTCTLELVRPPSLTFVTDDIPDKVNVVPSEETLLTTLYVSVLNPDREYFTIVSVDIPLKGLFVVLTVPSEPMVIWSCPLNPIGMNESKTESGKNAGLPEE